MTFILDLHFFQIFMLSTLHFIYFIFVIPLQYKMIFIFISFNANCLIFLFCLRLINASSFFPPSLVLFSTPFFLWLIKVYIFWFFSSYLSLFLNLFSYSLFLSSLFSFLLSFIYFFSVFLSFFKTSIRAISFFRIWFVFFTFLVNSSVVSLKSAIPILSRPGERKEERKVSKEESKKEREINK